MGCAKEVLHDGRILGLLLPHWFGPLLAREESAVEYDLDHADQLRAGLHYADDTLLQRLCLSNAPPVQTHGGPRASLVGGPDQNMRAAPQAASLGSVM